jgi:hypothetical protein
MRKADLEAIAKSLNDADVEFIVVGGIAVIEHGYGRNTFDLDIVIHLQEDAVIRVFAALARLGYRPRVPITAERLPILRSVAA